jgi:hypothetical protein
MSKINVPVVGVISAVVLVLQQYLKPGPVDWKALGLAALITAVSVIAKDWQKKGATVFGLIGVALTAAVDTFSTGMIQWGYTVLAILTAVGAAYVKSTQANQPPDNP